jgi:glycosyltransferase involved in cell wall biosynthesis
MKIAQISPTFFGRDSVVGGGERYALELARQLSRNAEVSLITFSRNRSEISVEVEGDLEIRRYPVRHLVAGNLANPANMAFLRDLRAFDILHCYGYPKMVTDLCLAFAKAYRKKLFVTDIGGGGACPSTYLSKFGIDTRRFVNGFLLLSDYSAEGYAEYHERVRVIYGGVDVGVFRPQAIPRRPGALFVGRLISAKGINYLVDALDSTTSLRIVGRPYDEVFWRTLQSMSQGKNVEFLTNASDVHLVREYSSALVTVVPSVRIDLDGNERAAELLSLAALESMACATPVIATTCGALPEVVEDGVTGFLVPPNDPAALWEKIRFFLDQPATARAMGEAGRERVLRLFTWDRVAGRCMQAYHKSLERSK